MSSTGFVRCDAGLAGEEFSGLRVIVGASNSGSWPVHNSRDSYLIAPVRTLDGFPNADGDDNDDGDDDHNQIVLCFSSNSELLSDFCSVATILDSILRVTISPLLTHLSHPHTRPTLITGAYQADQRVQESHQKNHFGDGSLYFLT